jgi:amino acid transporter
MTVPVETSRDDQELAALGYQQRMSRTIGAFTSFSVAFSMISITTALYTLFADPFTKVGGVGIWLWFLVTPGVLLITLVYMHLSARMPVTGYAYQWSSRLVSPHYGWATGWVAMFSFFAGTAAEAIALATVFAPEVWKHPTQHDIQFFSVAAILVAAVLNLLGVKIATWANNIGATLEFAGTVVLIAVTGIGLFFFHNKAGFSILLDHHVVGGGHLDFVIFGLAAFMPLTTLLGWEGAADLAEETKDPRRTAPRAMLQSVVAGGVLGFLGFAIFAMAIPHGTDALLGQSENPLLHIARTHYGSFAADAVIIISFAAIAAALVANLAVATRMCYSLSRDGMLPGSRWLGRIGRRSKVPVNAVLVVTVLSVAVNFMSASLVNEIFAIVGLTYYLTYLFTIVGALIAHRRGTMPNAPDGYFNLGRWLMPTMLAGIAWCLIVIAFYIFPAANRSTGLTTVYVLALGALWYVAHLRRRITAGTAGVQSKVVEAPTGTTPFGDQASPSGFGATTATAAPHNEGASE